MTKKTLVKISLFAVAVITVTAVVILSVFYSYSDSQLKDQLKSVEAVAEAELAQKNDYSFISNHIDSGIRITLVSPDGTVLADSVSDATEMANHSDREEIKKALKNGEATVIRQSETQNEKIYYYAKLLENGNILRVSASASDITSFFSGYIPYIIIGLAVIVAGAALVSVGITKSIVKPITKLGENLSSPEKVKTYDELKPLLDTIKQQNEKQKALDKQKKQFTANLSHELKTPLTSIAGYAELIESGFAKDEDIKPFAGVIRKEALRLVSVSEDIIQLSQLEENDDEELTFEDVDLYFVAEKCVRSLYLNAKNKQVDIKLNGEKCLIRGKENLIEELIYNLCDNAIRYNKPGGSVTVSAQPSENGARLSVKDTGIGIPEKYQERIFERFFRVDKSRSKATGGTGLGLAIVKHITQLHGAKLSVSSKENAGTQIIVDFYN